MRLGLTILVLSFLAITRLEAQSERLGTETPLPPTEVEAPPDNSKTARAASRLSVLGSYGVYSFLVSGKKGVQAGFIASDLWTYQLDYFAGDLGLKKYGLNLVSFEEKLMTLHARRYFGNSFNVLFGLGERSYTLELGSRVLNYIEPSLRDHYGSFTVKNYIVDFGLGNRWQWKNGITLGADWFSLEYPISKSRVSPDPVSEVEDGKTRRNLGRLVNTLKYVPTFTFFKLNFGYTF